MSRDDTIIMGYPIENINGDNFNCAGMNGVFIDNSELILGGARGSIDNSHYAGSVEALEDSEDKVTPLTQAFVLPLTYDEDDYNSEYSWVRRGGAPHVTPSGFEGDGYSARLSTEDIQSWMSSAVGPLSMQATISISEGRVMGTGPMGDVILFAGENVSGASPRPKMALSVISDPVIVEENLAAFYTYNTPFAAFAKIELFRREWKYQGRFPVLEVSGDKVRPQGFHFIDADTALISGHYDGAFSRVYKMDLTDWSVTGYFDVPSPGGGHINAISEDAAGNYWFFGNDSISRIDVDASLLTNAAVFDIEYDAGITKGSFGDIATLSGTEYVLVGEYNVNQTPIPRIYAIPLTSITDGGSFTSGDETNRWRINERVQGIKYNSGKIYMTMNRTTAEGSGSFGRIHEYTIAISDNDDTLITTPDEDHLAPSQYPEDLDFHPTTGDFWVATEGWDDVIDFDGFLGFWSSPLDGSSAENHVSVDCDASSNFAVKLNNLDFQEENHPQSQDIDIVSIGGPPSAAEDYASGHFKGFIKNIRFQSSVISSEEYLETISGDFESDTITSISVTSLTNLGAESGDTTGWTDEVGNMASKNSANRNPPEGSRYFDGDANLQTIASQRFSLLSASGMTQSELDASESWVKVRWQQSGYNQSDAGSMGVRTVNSSLTETSLEYGNLNPLPFIDGTIPYYIWQPLVKGLDISSGDEYVDVVYRADRTGGTNNDHYVDDVSVTIYQK